MKANVIEFVPREVYEKQMEETLQALSSKHGSIRVPNPNDNPVSRKRVVQAFMDAFELIGGVPRLAVWANENPDNFYSLYARLLPSSTSQALGEANEMIVRHVLPRTELDQLPPNLDDERKARQ